MTLHAGRVPKRPGLHERSASAPLGHLSLVRQDFQPRGRASYLPYVCTGKPIQD